MPIRSKNRTVVLVVFAFVFWAVWEFPLASYRGALTARIDIARGHLVVLGYGFPSASRPQYESILKKRYGIEYRAVAGCIVSQTQVGYVSGYNQVSEAVAKHRFGANLFAEVSAESETQTRRLHPEYYRASAR